MVDLKCKCGKCEHNSNCNCYARCIMVGASAECKTYQKSKDENKTEYSDEIVQPLVRPSVEVMCRANCLFNKQGKCKANGISVQIDNNNVECSTFLPK